MSEGSVYQRKDGRWCAKYKDDTGQWRYLYRANKKEARAALRQALKDRDEGVAPLNKMTVNQLFDQWLEQLEYKVSERTWLNRESLVRCHVKPTIGIKKLAALNHTDIQRLYRSKLDEGLAPSSVERIHVLISQVLKIATRRKYIRDNPMDEVTPPKVYRKEKEILSPEQTKHLMNTVRGQRFELAVLLGATMALRVNETLALRWEDIDLDKGIISIRHTLWRGECCNPKTQSSMAVLQIPTVTREALERVRSNGEGTGWLFPTRSNRPVCSADFHKYWKKIIKQAGLPDITYQALRHGVCSYLLNQKTPLPVTSKFVRHSNPAITARIYSHIVYGTEGMAADGIDHALG